MDQRLQRDFRKVESNARHGDLDGLIELVGGWLAKDESLASKYRDHSLGGAYAGHRECHLKPDLLLIYKKPDEVTVRFVRVGSHSELF